MIGEYYLGYLDDTIFGPPVTHNFTDALLWYRKAAEQGSADAEAGIGRLYSLGWGVPQSYQEALKWFQKAAAQGNGFADYSIGYLYFQSQIGKNDYQDALKWFQKAVNDGFPNAQKTVDRVKKQMGN
jgi:TPR repeat protein